jgi:hypothetical protein
VRGGDSKIDGNSNHGNQATHWNVGLTPDIAYQDFIK